MTNSEIDFIMDSIEKTAKHFPKWKKDYTYQAETNEFSKTTIETKNVHTSTPYKLSGFLNAV